MIKKVRRRPRTWQVVSFALALVGCAQSRRPSGYSGVLEYDERLVAFEVGGRLLERTAERGQRVEQGALIARLDSSLEEANRAVQEQQARAADARASLVAAGPKPSDLMSLLSRIRAARAVESRLETTLRREATLAEKNITPQSVVDDLRQQLAQASAERRALQAQYRSLATGARQEEIASAQAQAEAARSALALLDERIRRYELRAPLDGEVVEVHVDPGETVAAGTPVVTIADVTRPLVEVFVPQGQIAGVELGRKAELRVDGLAGTFPGEVEYVSRKLEFTPRFIFSEEERPRLVVRVRVRVDDPKAQLHAGIPAFVRFL